MVINLEDYRLHPEHLAQFGLTESNRPTTRTQIRKKRRRPGAFIEGPIPVAWLIAAAGVAPLSKQGKLWPVVHAIWFTRGVTKSNRFYLTPHRLSTLQVSSRTASKWLQELASAGLLKVQCQRGCSPLVELLAVEPLAETDPIQD